MSIRASCTSASPAARLATASVSPLPLAKASAAERAQPGPAAGRLAPVPGNGRHAVATRAARVQQVQRACGNQAAQRVVRRFEGAANDVAPESPRHPPSPVNPSRAPGAPGAVSRRIQRDAAPTANDVQGDAVRQEAAVRGDATAGADDLDRQGVAASAPLQADAGAQGARLGADAAAHGAALTQQAAAQGAALQAQQQGQAATLGAESAAQGASLQQQAGGAAARLRADEAALENTARAAEAQADGALATDAGALRNEAGATDGSLQAQWSGLERQTTGRLDGMSARTQALVDQKTALVREYQGPGPHDPERFQRRWAALQERIAPLEQEQAALGAVEPAALALEDRAGAIWERLTGRGRALMDRVGAVATAAWTSLQGRWSALQAVAAGMLGALQGSVGAAVARMRSLAAAAWSGLQAGATSAWTGLQGVATGAWTGLQAGATAAWTALKSRASAAWTALQGVAGSVVGALSSRISGVLGRIGSAISRIVAAVTDALGSVMSRLRSATSSALSFLRTRASAAWNAVKSVGNRAWGGLRELGQRAWSGLKSLGTRAWSGLRDLGNRAWNRVKDLGTRAWNGLQDLGRRAWNGLRSGWDALKRKAQAAWNGIKRAWDAVRRRAAQAWDWLKRKAREALAWLRRQWARLKALLRRAWDWLKAKWRWLKELVKLTIRIPDQTLCKVRNFKPWKFVDLQGGRIPIVRTVVDPGIGPIELALFVQPRAEATIGGSIGPCTLKNIQFTLQPLVSRYTGQADFHVAGSVAETLSISGMIGGTANYGGLIGLVGGGLEGRGSATALGSFGAKPRFVYDSGDVSVSVPVSFEFCLMPRLDVGAFVTAKLIAGQPPAATPPAPTPTPLLPRPPTLPGPVPLPTPGAPALSGGCWNKGGGGGGSGGTQPKEEVLREWTKRWHLGSWSKKECWRLGAHLQLAVGPGGLPQAELDFDAAPIALEDVIRNMFDLPPLPGGGAPGASPGGAPGDPEIQKTVTASGRCKCVGDDNCGGGKIYEVCYTTQKDCKKAQKDLDDFCNNNGEMKGKCTRPKCYYRHSDPCCPDECNPGDIRPLEIEPVVPMAACPAVTPSGGPTVNNPAGGNTCTPDIPRPDWGVIEADSANWGVCVSGLPLSGTINIKPWPSQPTRMVTPNTANPQDGGNIDNTAGSRNHWQFAIDDMADYDSTGRGGAGAYWHATRASEAHEWAHWNLDFKDDALMSAAGGDWARANADLNALREPKSASSTPAAARAALQPRVDAQVASFRSAVLGRWNTLIRTTDKPGQGGRGYAAGMSVLDQYIASVRAYKDTKGW